MEAPLSTKTLYHDVDAVRDVGRANKRFRRLFLSEAISNGDGSASISKILSATTAIHLKLHNLTSTVDHVGVSGSAGEIFQLNANGLPVSSGKAFKTSVDDPGSDLYIPTEAAVRSRLNSLFSAITIGGEPTGFLSKNSATITFNSGTSSTVRIAATSGTFEYWINGIEHNVATATKTFTGNPDHGLWYFFMTPSETLAATSTFSTILFSDYAIAAIGYWDSVNHRWIYRGTEMHGLTMDWQSHLHDHLSIGAVRISGFGLSGFTIAAGAPTGETEGTFTVSEGVIRDEDLSFTHGSFASPTPIQCFYRSGASNWLMQTASAMPVIFGSSLLRYNTLVSGSWTQATCTNTYHVLCHLFAVTDENLKVIAIQGQNQYRTLAEARAGADTEMYGLITAGMPVPEWAPIATIIYKTETTYTSNSKHCKIVEYETGFPYVDWSAIRKTSIAGVSVAAHNSLSGLQGGTVGEYYHLDAASSAISIPDLLARIIALEGGGTLSKLVTEDGNDILTADGNYIYVVRS